MLNMVNKRSSVRFFVIACVVLFFFSGVALSAITLKVSSAAPQNSDWGRILESIGSEFRSVTNGDIEWRIFHNGIAGNEADVVRKMRLGQIDIAILTSVGVGAIDGSVLTLSAPGLITNAKELEYVLSRFGPTLQKEINQTPYEVLGWAGVGWLYPFASVSFDSPKDLRNIKIATSGSENLTQFYRDIGYNPVPISFTEWLTALNSGLVDGFFGSPTAAAGFQWFGIADNMADVRLAPFMGAIVISDRAWKKVDDKYKPRLRAVIEEHLNELTEESAKLEQRSIDTMKRFGLNVIELSETQKQEWADFYDINNFIRQGGRSAELLKELFDLRLYNLVKNELTRYRAQQ